MSSNTTATTYNKDLLEETQTKVNKALAKIYLNPDDPGALGGAERLYRRAHEIGLKGANRRAVRHYLAGEAAYSLLRSARRHFSRNRSYVQGIDEQGQADLVDM